MTEPVEASNFIFLPGYGGSGPQHWQSLWHAKLPESQWLTQKDWDEPQPEDWVATLDAAIAKSPKPPILVGHSLGATTVVQWAATRKRPVGGAFLVAPPDLDLPSTPEPCRRFAPVALIPLPFPSLLLASNNDTFASRTRVQAFARAWHSKLVDVGNVGHINVESGHGPWLQGWEMLIAFAAALTGK